MRKRVIDRSCCYLSVCHLVILSGSRWFIWVYVPFKQDDFSSLVIQHTQLKLIGGNGERWQRHMRTSIEDQLTLWTNYKSIPANRWMSRFLLFSFCGSLQIVSIDVMHQKQKTQQKNDNSLARSLSFHKSTVNKRDGWMYIYACVRENAYGRWQVYNWKREENRIDARVIFCQ